MPNATGLRLWRSPGMIDDPHRAGGDSEAETDENDQTKLCGRRKIANGCLHTDRDSGPAIVFEAATNDQAEPRRSITVRLQTGRSSGVGCRGWLGSESFILS